MHGSQIIYFIISCSNPFFFLPNRFQSSLNHLRINFERFRICIGYRINRSFPPIIIISLTFLTKFPINNPKIKYLFKPMLDSRSSEKKGYLKTFASQTSFPSKKKKRKRRKKSKTHECPIEHPIFFHRKKKKEREREVRKEVR